MYRHFTSLLALSLIALAGWGFWSYGTGRGYSTYIANWEYRRLHPELIAPSDMIKIFDMGHTSSYASFAWLGLIQYIGDNVGGNRFLDFSHTILDQITTLHPYFVRPYEIDLILAPVSTGENSTREKINKNQKIIANAITLGEKGIQTLCDASKISRIKEMEISENLWNDKTLRDPCASGMLPYYLAFTLYQTSNNKSESSTYYKIASMNHDAPTASRILSLLALSADGDYRSSATNLALIGSTGYDVAPYVCRELAGSLTRDLIQGRRSDTVWVNELIRQEVSLIDTRDPKDPLSNSSDNCYDMTTRSIKHIYLEHISGLAAGTDARSGDDLIQLGKIKNIPTLSTQAGYGVRIKNSIWEYQAK